MSSNIKVTKVREYCGQEFIAKTIQTRYCSHSCNSKAYKQNKRKEMVESDTIKKTPANPPKRSSPSINYANLNAKEFLTMNDCGKLLNITTVTLGRWIKDGVIEAKRLGKKHIIKRESIDNMLVF